MLRLPVILLLLLSGQFLSAQSDSTKIDSMLKKPLAKDTWGVANWVPDNAQQLQAGTTMERKINNQNFYFAIGILLLFATIKLFFGKYLSDIFHLISRSSMRTDHIRDMLVNNVGASALLNLFFGVIVGTIVYLSIKANGVYFKLNNIFLLALCIGAVLLIYLVKFIFSVFIGWVFSLQDAMNRYIFIVNFFNKIVGIVLMPMAVIMFLAPDWNAELVGVSICIIFMFYLYRNFLAFSTLRKNIQMSSFHFFLYFCTAEIMPVLLIIKLVLNGTKNFF
jgi:hypothetical protein